MPASSDSGSIPFFLTRDADQPDELSADDDPVGVVLELLLLLECPRPVVVPAADLGALQVDAEVARLEEHVEADPRGDRPVGVRAVARLTPVD